MRSLNGLFDKQPPQEERPLEPTSERDTRNLFVRETHQGAHRPLLIAVMGTRAGSTSTYWATSLAWTIATAGHTTMLMDCDMECGTIEGLLNFDRRARRGLSNIVGTRATAQDIEAQSVPHKKVDKLKVVGGLWGQYGPEITNPLRFFGESLKSISAEVVIADLGHPFSHAGITNPHEVAVQITETFDRIFVLVRDSPELFPRALDALKLADFSRGEIVLSQQQNNQFVGLITKSLQDQLPLMPVVSVFPWDQKRALDMSMSAVPMSLEDVPAKLNLLPKGKTA